MRINIGTQMIDIAEPSADVEVLVAADGDTLWVNVDGMCRLRVCFIKPQAMLRIEDRRQR